MADNDTETVERILVVAAHPDDIDFGMAGSVATWTSEGIDVTYCVVTDGDAGGYDLSVSREDMKKIRHDEQRAAAACVGVERVEFLGYKDGALYVTHELRRDLSRVIRQVRPQRVLCPSPERNYERVFASHPDHLAAGEATLCAVYPDARNPFAHPELLDDEGLEPWSVPEVWMGAGSSGGATTFVDITDAIDKKVEALRAHVSQTSHMENLAEFIRAWGAATAKSAGWDEGRLGEAFRVVKTA